MSHGHHDHHHEHAPGLLSPAEQRQAGRQLLQAMFAIGLLLLAGGWHWAVPGGDAVAALLTGAASLLMAGPVLRAAWHSLRHPDLHGLTDLLIALAVIGAWASGDLLAAALLPILMVLGHVLEERSLLGAKEAIQALLQLTQSRARRLSADGAIDEVDNTALQPGDRVEVRAGDRIPADGRVCDGHSSLDTSPITGESLPRDVAPGETVFGGTVNLAGRLVIEVTQVGEASTLGRVSALMREAERSKPPITRLMERYAGPYLALVLAVAALTWFVSHDTEAMLAVLVAACPCALVLAAPATAVAGVAVAARHGILIRGSAFLEELADVSALVIDKTGTLTHGQLGLAHVDQVDAGPGPAPLTLAASLGRFSSHPVSRALSRQAAGGEEVELSEVREEQGMGLTATTRWGAAALGRPELFARLGIAAPPPPSHPGSVAGLALDGRFLAWFRLTDTLRDEAPEAVGQLRALGLTHQLLLTGDHADAAVPLAEALGIAAVETQMLPADKLRQVQAQIDAGYRPLVVGDGINDSLALKAGAVGVAIGSERADIAVSAADVVLIGNDLRRLSTAIRLSRRCRRTLSANVAIGLGWAAALTALAAFGLLGSAGVLTAALLHNLSTLLVMGNAARLLRFHEPLSG